MRSWTLRHLDGDFSIVTAPPVLDRNFQLHSKLIRLYHIELQSSLAGINVWPPEDVADLIYSKLPRHFQKLGALFDPPIETDCLDPISRHQFFVCTDPVTIPGYDKPVPGLSGLEQIMGFTHADPNAEPVKLEYSTGDPELDILVDSLLIFKDRGLKLAQMLSLEDLCKVCKQGNDRMRVDNSEGPSEKPEEPWKENEKFVERKDRISQSLNDLGVWMP